MKAFCIFFLVRAYVNMTLENQQKEKKKMETKQKKHKITETVNILSVGCEMCKQTGAIERTGVFSCLVI